METEMQRKARLLREEAFLRMAIRDHTAVAKRVLLRYNRANSITMESFSPQRSASERKPIGKIVLDPLRSPPQVDHKCQAHMQKAMTGERFVEDSASSRKLANNTRLAVSQAADKATPRAEKARGDRKAMRAERFAEENGASKNMENSIAVDLAAYKASLEYSAAVKALADVKAAERAAQERAAAEVAQREVAQRLADIEAARQRAQKEKEERLERELHEQKNNNHAMQMRAEARQLVMAEALEKAEKVNLDVDKARHAARQAAVERAAAKTERALAKKNRACAKALAESAAAETAIARTKREAAEAAAERAAIVRDEAHNDRILAKAELIRARADKRAAKAAKQASDQANREAMRLLQEATVAASKADNDAKRADAAAAKAAADMAVAREAQKRIAPGKTWMMQRKR